MIEAFCDGGGDNIHRTYFYCSFKVGDYLSSRMPLEVNSVNESEYMALIKLLEFVLLTGTNEGIIIRSDSKLVVEQVNGGWRVHKKTLVPFYLKAIGLIQSIKQKYSKPILLQWTSRENIVPVLGH